MACPQIIRPAVVRLPSSSTRLAKHLAFVRLVEAVRETPAGTAFQGKLYRPGQDIAVEEMAEYPVALECAGPVTPGRGHNRSEVLWILWRWDRERSEWREVARAQSTGGDWAEVLRAACLQALHPVAELVDASKRSVEAAGQIMEFVDQLLAGEVEEIRRTVLGLVYDQVAGRLVHL